MDKTFKYFIKRNSLGVFIVALSFLFLCVPVKGASSNGGNVSGWAWSENIGWISFNCTDTSSCASSTYGVNVDQAGNVTGYAWSENIGWVRLDPPGPYPNQPNTSTHLSNGNNQVTGWARACAAAADTTNCSGGTNSTSGGWDGWIKMAKQPSDTGSNYGVTYDPSTGQFHGWAWGSNSVGWISFNCQEGGNSGANVCSSSNYKVIGSLNQPPVAAISCTTNDPSGDCTGYTGSGGSLVFNNNSTDPEGPLDIVKSTWDILNWGSNPDATCTSSGSQTPNPALCNYTAQTIVLTPGSYTISLTVTDSSGATSTATQAFTIVQGPVASFSCSINGGTNWVSCATISPGQGQAVSFKDTSTPSPGASITSYAWTFQDGNPGTANTSTATTSFGAPPGAKQVTLTIHDSSGRTASTQTTINVGISFPQIQEISPF